MEKKFSTNDISLSSSSFSDEIPELLQEHLGHLKTSSISLDVMRERGYRSILGKKELLELGFSKAQCRTPGIFMPVWSPTGENTTHQYKPDDPRHNKKGKAIKYETPVGSRIHLDVPPRCRSVIGNPHVPLWITEGIKKGDALASHDACAISLMGVWGMVGRNLQGGITTLSEWRDIALNGRTVYVCYDSDVVLKRPVQQALDILVGLLERRKAKVYVVCLPTPTGEKVGIDDFLRSHSLDEAIGLARKPEEAPTLSGGYRIEDGRICRVVIEKGGMEKVQPLCNFAARVTEDITKDSGIEVERYFLVEGELAGGRPLPRVQIPASSFSGLGWVVSNWGVGAVITAGISLRDHLREAIQLLSYQASKRVVYTHTGWREVEGKRIFLTACGALGSQEIEVELESPLQRYRLPTEATVDPKEAIKASLDFLDIGEAKITVPLWAAMYLAPLSEVLNPAFTLWLVGTTGTLKSTLQALALSHFGEFTVRSLPASWRDTANYLGKLMALAKDMPLVIDDWVPAPDTKQAREYEVKAEQVARAQGNRLGRGRLRTDTSMRPAYIPRGVVVTNGEQLPSGQSHTARLFTTEIEPGDIDLRRLTTAQEAAHLYPPAMAGYIEWLSPQWDDIQKELPGEWNQWRQQAQTKGQHPRVPEAVAWLYAGFDMAMAFAEEMGVIRHSEARERRNEAWDTLIRLADMQGGRVEEERPARRFLEGLKALIDEGKVVFRHKDEEEPAKASMVETQIGWRGDEGVVYLNPYPAYGAVYEFCRRSGEPLTFKASAVWKDLNRMGLSICEDGRTTTTARLFGKSKRVIALKVKALHDV